MPRTRPAARFHHGLLYRHYGIAESAGSRKHNLNKSRHQPRDALAPGSTQDMTATETFDVFRRFWVKHYDAMELLIMDSGHRIWRRLSTLVPIQ